MTIAAALLFLFSSYSTAPTIVTPAIDVQPNLPSTAVKPEGTIVHLTLRRTEGTAITFTPPTTSTLYVGDQVNQGLIWSPEVGVQISHDDNTRILYRKHRFEGDIVFASNTASIIDYNNNTITKISNDSQMERNDYSTHIAVIQYNAVRQKTLLWPNGRIPYTISSKYPDSSKLIIEEAFEEYRQWTCVRFVPKEPHDVDFIDILPDDGCYSMVGNNGGKQVLSLGDGCLSKGIAIHELMHVLGFYHEQSRADRDLYVDVHWENVDPSLVDQFDKYSTATSDDLSAPYDYGSVMHYATWAFSKNGEPTITPKAGNENIEIGQRRGFSPLDIWKINKVYNCSDYLTTAASITILTTWLPTETITSRNYNTTATTAANNSIENSTATTDGLKINLNLSTLPSPFTVIDLNALLGLFGTPPTTISTTETVATEMASYTITTTATIPELQKGQRCEDRHPNCLMLAFRGICLSHPRFVDDYCARTCGRCTEECMDRTQLCTAWVITGMCTNSGMSQFMDENCARSCGKCGIKIL